MSENKKKFETIDEYINMFPENIQKILGKIRQIIRASAPKAVETISYQIPTFKLRGNLVHFAAYKKHIGFYPTPSGIETFKEELDPYEVSKGSVKFPLNKPIPYSLVKKIVEFRVKENMEKKK
ncbi:MAG: iron chaperone [Promethearchaeota archaeon]